jgi:hypothetical protein
MSELALSTGEQEIALAETQAVLDAAVRRVRQNCGLAAAIGETGRGRARPTRADRGLAQAGRSRRPGPPGEQA